MSDTVFPVLLSSAVWNNISCILSLQLYLFSLKVTRTDVSKSSTYDIIVSLVQLGDWDICFYILPIHQYLWSHLVIWTYVSVSKFHAVVSLVPLGNWDICFCMHIMQQYLLSNFVTGTYVSVSCLSTSISCPTRLLGHIFL